MRYDTYDLLLDLGELVLEQGELLLVAVLELLEVAGDVAQDGEDVDFPEPRADVEAEAGEAAVDGEDVRVCVGVRGFAVGEGHYYRGGVASRGGQRGGNGGRGRHTALRDLGAAQGRRERRG